MVLTGGNYALYYRAWQKGWGVLWENMEFRVYLLIVAAATILIGLNLAGSLGEGPTTALLLVFPGGVHRYDGLRLGRL